MLVLFSLKYFPITFPSAVIISEAKLLVGFSNSVKSGNGSKLSVPCFAPKNKTYRNRKGSKTINQNNNTFFILFGSCCLDVFLSVFKCYENKVVYISGKYIDFSSKGNKNILKTKHILSHIF